MTGVFMGMTYVYLIMTDVFMGMMCLLMGLTDVFVLVFGVLVRWIFVV